jgi:hypothetical protein
VTDGLFEGPPPAHDAFFACIAATIREQRLELPALPAQGALDNDALTRGRATTAHIDASQPMGGPP